MAIGTRKGAQARSFFSEAANLQNRHKSYIKGWRFVVTGDGFNSTAFSGVTLPSISTKYKSLQEGGYNHGPRDLFDGFEITGNLVLRRAFSKDMDLVNWAYGPARIFKRVQYPYKKNLTIDFFSADSDEIPAIAVDIFGAKPVSYSTGSVEANRGQLVLETISCRVEGMMIKKTGQEADALEAYNLLKNVLQ